MRQKHFRNSVSDVNVLHLNNYQHLVDLNTKQILAPIFKKTHENHAYVTSIHINDEKPA